MKGQNTELWNHPYIIVKAFLRQNGKLCPQSGTEKGQGYPTPGGYQVWQTFPAPTEMLQLTHFNRDWNKSGYLEIDIRYYYPTQSALHLISKTTAGGSLRGHFSDFCVFPSVLTNKPISSECCLWTMQPLALVSLDSLWQLTRSQSPWVCRQVGL